MLPNNIPITFPIVLKKIVNYDKGRKGMCPNLIIVHITEGSKESVYQTFLNQTPGQRKSTHLMINKDGSIWQFVSTNHTAWGNGIVNNPISEVVLSRKGINPNLYTISIENEGSSLVDITPKQYQTNIKLISFLCKKWNIPINSTHIIRHREINSGKSCPGLINVEKIIQQVRLIK